MNPTTFRIGGDLEVGRLGFGAMHLPTERGQAWQDSIAVARRAVELGVTLIDTAYLYAWGANEELLAEALFPYPPELLVTTKVGIARSEETGEWGLDGRPEVLGKQVERALRVLRVERLELLQLHRIDPEVPLDEQVGALRELKEAGKIGRIGLSEVGVGELEAARRITDIASVQNRYSLLHREHEQVLSACAEAGIAFLSWRPVAGATPETSARWGTEDDSGISDVVADVAAEVEATPAQVALAWLLARSPVVLPIPGTGKMAHLEQNLAAAEVELSAEQWARLDATRRDVDTVGV
ncbi:oxidoreductase [Prauserella marina]|uniref:Predicted oxidoreductase n=1 Tax=Prauserella marina TaxID=530584 RepID=A0A222VNP3_9PSEU|nr:aldo/keto reductase [Prauserella marina]ASR35528.1 oxidoreductase [Prauserella marina]PWV84635.1 aryl-alcohol dehydrogenase-like predicted oxidoreductase [Prauserella marina]SDC17082.1 Predicted oxidoreductase [Prauserella marina]